MQRVRSHTRHGKESTHAKRKLMRCRSLAHGRGGARSEEGAEAKGKKPSKLRARRRKLPAPPVAPRELPGVPPGLRLASDEAAAAGEPAGPSSDDTGG